MNATSGSIAIFVALLFFVPSLSAQGTWRLDRHSWMHEQTIYDSDSSKRSYRIYNKGRKSIDVLVRFVADRTNYEKVELLPDSYVDVCGVKIKVRLRIRRGSSSGTYEKANADSGEVQWRISTPQESSLPIYYGADAKCIRICCEAGKIEVYSDDKSVATLYKGQCLDLVGNEIRITGNKGCWGTYGHAK